MLPEALLLYSLRDDVVRPVFLGEQDHPWLRRLLDEVSALAEESERDLERRLREMRFADEVVRKARLASHVLRRSLQPATSRDRRGQRLRADVFQEAARSGGDTAAVLGVVAAHWSTTVTEIRTALFADLPGERAVGNVPASLSPAALALRVNLALAQSLLYRSTAVRISLDGNARAVVRYAKLCGLICQVERSPHPILVISGPYTLFRRTLVYGRALGQLLPQLAWCRQFQLEADCVLRGVPCRLRLQSGDPLAPASEPRSYDSRLEAALACDLRRLAPDWDVIREPEPVPAGDTLIFPDFGLRHRYDGRSWLLEIIGFWTPDYVARKLAHLRAAGLDNLIVCIDDGRRCAAEELPPGARVVRYRRRIDAHAVVTLLDRG